MSSPTTTPTATPDDGPAWLSVAQASAALGISTKTVWRRARSGELTARKVTGARGALVWEIQCGQTIRPTGQKQAANHAANRPQSPEIERDKSGQTMRPPTGQPAKASGQSDTGDGREIEAVLRAQLDAMNAALEREQRAHEQTRQLLAGALQMHARQLPNATPTEPQREARNGAADTDSPAPAKARERGARRDGGPLTYGDIADDLEADLLRRENNPT